MPPEDSWPAESERAAIKEKRGTRSMTLKPTHLKGGKCQDLDHLTSKTNNYHLLLIIVIFSLLHTSTFIIWRKLRKGGLVEIRLTLCLSFSHLLLLTCVQRKLANSQLLINVKPTMTRAECKFHFSRLSYVLNVSGSITTMGSSKLLQTFVYLKRHSNRTKRVLIYQKQEFDWF